MGTVKNYMIGRDNVIDNLKIYLSIIKDFANKSKFGLDIYKKGIMIIEQLESPHLFIQTMNFIDHTQYVLDKYIETV